MVGLAVTVVFLVLRGVPGASLLLLLFLVVVSSSSSTLATAFLGLPGFLAGRSRVVCTTGILALAMAISSVNVRVWK